MGIKKSTFARHAWAALRMALLWARKGGAFRRADRRRIECGARQHLERQFSFDETPAFHFKMHRPASLRWISSCVDPPAVDFDDCDDERNYFRWDKRSDTDDDGVAQRGEEGSELGCGAEGSEVNEEEGIDTKAEEFIARFYDQMKLQRQISFLQYSEMLERSSS